MHAGMHALTCMHAHIHTKHVEMYLYVRGTYMYMYLYTYLHACIHACIQTYINTCIHILHRCTYTSEGYICTCICLHTYIHIFEIERQTDKQRHIHILICGRSCSWARSTFCSTRVLVCEGGRVCASESVILVCVRCVCEM